MQTWEINPHVYPRDEAEAFDLFPSAIEAIFVAHQEFLEAAPPPEEDDDEEFFLVFEEPDHA